MHSAQSFHSQLPPMVNYSMAGRTYRYFEGDPLYPFGYGLSYTTFTYSDLSVPATVAAGKDLQGQVKVQNAGQVDSDEVRVQLYYIKTSETDLCYIMICKIIQCCCLKELNNGETTGHQCHVLMLAPLAFFFLFFNNCYHLQ